MCGRVMGGGGDTGGHRSDQLQGGRTPSDRVSDTGDISVDTGDISADTGDI